MKRKGFTLVELLAVIVILAVISIITVPLIGNIIEKIRREAFKDSVLSAFKATEYYVALNALSGIPESGIPESGIDVKSLNLKNNTFTSGRMIENKEKELIAEFISDGNYCATGTITNLNVNKGECEITSPSVEASVNEKKITLVLNDEYGIVAYAITSTENEIDKWIEINETLNETIIFDAEKAGTYYVYVKNKYGKESTTNYNVPVTAFAQYMLASSDYTTGTEIKWAGLDWYVLKDNGNTTSLILKNNYTTGAYGDNVDFATSTANEMINTNFIDDNEALQVAVIDGSIKIDETTNTNFRLITKEEASTYGTKIVNGSNTPYWTITESGSNVYYALSNGAISYTKYVQSNSSKTCYSTYEYDVFCGRDWCNATISYSKKVSGVKSSKVDTVAAPTSTKVVSTNYSYKSIGTDGCDTNSCSQWGGSDCGYEEVSCDYVSWTNYSAVSPSTSPVGYRPVVSVNEIQE